MQENKEYVIMSRSTYDSGGGSGGGSLQFGVVLSDSHPDYVANPPILVNGVPYSGEWTETSDCLVGTAHAGDVITLSEEVIPDGGISAVYFDDKGNQFQAEGCPFSIVSSKQSVLYAEGVVPLNLLVEYTADSGTARDISVRLGSRSNPQRLLPTFVPEGQNVYVSGSIVKVWYRIGDGDLVEIDNVMDVGYRFTMPSDVVTIVVKADDMPE